MRKPAALLLFAALLIILVGSPAPARDTDVETGEIDGARFRIQIPSGKIRGLVVYAHGYRSRGGMWYPLGESLCSVFLERGYAVAESGYSRQGWALEEAMRDTEALRRYFVERHGAPQTTFIAGHSMGGLISLACVETFPDAYSGALTLCGPLVPAVRFFKDPVFDMLVTFDALFGKAMPDEQRPVIEAAALSAQSVEQALASSPDLADIIARHWGIKRKELASNVALYHLLYRELVDRVGGNPVDNRNTVYTGFAPIREGKIDPPRYAADKAALDYLRRHYTPTGRLEDPVMAVHTAYDPGVPPRLANFYGETAALQGCEAFFVQKYVEAEGHCNISPDLTAAAFDELTRWAVEGVRPEPGLLRVPEKNSGLIPDAGRGEDEAAAYPRTPEEIEPWWKSGRTLPLETAALFPLNEVGIQNDRGINLLVDMAHKCDFFLLWNLGPKLHRQGIRTAGSHAVLDSVLSPGSPCRVRIPVGPKLHPFAWWPAPRFNVVLTEGPPNYPAYTPAEREALKRFVKEGGGLIVSGARINDAQAAEAWSLNALLAEFDAAILPGQSRQEKRRWPLLRVSDEWAKVIGAEGGEPICARRLYGKGRIVLLASSGLFRFDRKDSEDVKRKVRFLAETVVWAAAGSPPAAGAPRLPEPMYGGGGIYPESEERLDGIACYYSRNQIPELLRTVKNDFPAITDDLYAWLPSPRPEQPMYLVLCSGGGGGWAVNAYLPKEASTISTSSDGIRSIFGHEQAHTMSGPCGAANHPFGGNQGEEHAGWFQGKIIAKYNGAPGPNRNCHSVIRSDYKGGGKEPGEIFKKKHQGAWRKGHDRLMIWYVWQKLDDRYGPTWYPRWRWVQGRRWENEPGRKLTWEESIEDMSIAVGEDLFPFFRKTGKELDRKRFAKAEFLGEIVELPVAPIEPTAPGNVRLDPIGDYKKPINP